MPKICEYQNEQGYRCETEATYGIKEQKTIFCKKHKRKEMKYVKGRYFCFCGKNLLCFGLTSD